MAAPTITDSTTIGDLLAALRSGSVSSVVIDRIMNPNTPATLYVRLNQGTATPRSIIVDSSAQTTLGAALQEAANAYWSATGQ
jgi:hypothetical protein